jgi:hypothetical protein
MMPDGRRPAGRRGTLTAAFLVSILLATFVSHAQTTTSSLTGTVRMPDGSAAPMALVVARSAATGAERAVMAGIEGSYRIDLLPPGTWNVVARLGEAMISDTRTVALGLQQTLRLDLEVGSTISEHVTVSAESPLVDPDRPLGEFHIENEQINVLPLDGRDYTDLALLDSAARPPLDGGFLGEREPVLIVNGQSPRSNSFRVRPRQRRDSQHHHRAGRQRPVGRGLRAGGQPPAQRAGRVHRIVAGAGRDRQYRLAPAGRVQLQRPPEARQGVLLPRLRAHE